MQNRAMTARALGIALFAALLLGGCSKRAGESPEVAAKRFYDFYLAEPINNGLPSIEQCRQMAPILSRGLQDAIGRARREQDKYISEHPGEKPPWSEGDLFTSLYEGATAYEIASVDPGEKHTDVVVKLTHESRGHRVAWTDRLVLVRENDRWVVENVEYGGTWDFANQGDLLKWLAPMQLEPEETTPAPAATPPPVDG